MTNAERVVSGGVLLVDDDVGPLRTASQALVTEGFEVMCAQFGAGALHHLNQGFGQPSW
jgi:DNA-binding response OmpR family regulator